MLAYGARRRDRLDDLFVAPEAMGLGLGRLLLTRLRGHALAAGHRQLTLDADPFAAGFYRRQGARLVGRVVGCVSGGEYERPSADGQ